MQRLSSRGYRELHCVLLPDQVAVLFPGAIRLFPPIPQV